ncbi:MAG: SDR family NAD(P)-dependent oxidoreductase [Pseudomonadales bacterium]|nr:SDR family NAD(P)-dependent oxidoreductase [Pseudomonadales bacterium]
MQNISQRYPGLALITGASSGIGEQFAYALAKDGMDLILVARRKPELVALQKKLIFEYGVSVFIQPCDLSNPVAVADLLAELADKDISLLISNAGFGVPKGAYIDADMADMQDMWQVNSLSPALLAQFFAKKFKNRNSLSAMIFTGSIEGESAFPYSSAYAASKAFLHSLVYGLAVELRPLGIDVLLLAPGATDTQAPINQGISRDQLVGLMAPAAVVDQALAKLGRGPRCIPGWHNRVFVYLLSALPVKVSTSLSAWGMLQAMRKSQP